MNKINCLAPYGHYHLDTHGYIKPCCKYTVDIENRIRDYDTLESIGAELAAHLMIDENVDNGCRQCKMYDDQKLDSLRIRLNKVIEEKDDLHKVKHLEVSLDSVCNFACIICDGSRSSKWRSLQKHLEWTPKDIPEDTNHYHNVMRLLQNSDISQLKEIRMLGGEPFYSKNFENFINLIESKCDITKVSIIVTTNLSVFPSDHLLSMLLKFKQFRIMASLDGVGTTAEVVRYGTKWNEVEDNIKRWLSVQARNPKQMFLAFTPTFHLYNIEHSKALADWYVKTSAFRNPIVFTLAKEPWLSFQVLEQDFRKQFEVKYWDHHNWKVPENFFERWPTVKKVDYDLIFKYIDTYSNMVGIDIASTIPQVVEQLKRQQDVQVQ